MVDRRSFVVGTAGFVVGGACLADARRVALRPWWTVDQFEGVAAVEDRILALVNEARQAAEVPAVRPHVGLQAASRQHSREMVLEGYFAHESPHPGWSEPRLRAYRAGYWEAFVAENIVYLDTGGVTMGDEALADWFMNGEGGWMDSPPHRANILDRQYTHLGVGVYVQGSKHYATQLFGQHYYEFSDLVLAAERDRYELSGRAKLTVSDRKVYVALDDRLLRTISASRGQWFDFRVPLPRGSGRHRIGLHPGKDARTYWIKYLFYIDSNQPPQQAFVLPFDP